MDMNKKILIAFPIVAIVIMLIVSNRAEGFEGKWQDTFMPNARPSTIEFNGNTVKLTIFSPNVGEHITMTGKYTTSKSNNVTYINISWDGGNFLDPKANQALYHRIPTGQYVVFWKGINFYKA